MARTKTPRKRLSARDAAAVGAAQREAAAATVRVERVDPFTEDLDDRSRRVAASGELRESEAEIRVLGEEAKARYLQLCREDFNTFVEHVGRDEETLEPIQQADFHVRCAAALDVHKNVVILSHPESGKTQNIAVLRVIWKLGNNPNLRVLLLNRAENGAKNTLSTIKRYIEESAALHEVFPNLKRGTVWKDAEIVVQRPTYARTPSIVAAGFDSKKIHGGRFDMIVVDDLLDVGNTSTEAQRRKLLKWFTLQVLTRRTRSAECAFLTNAWHPKDLAHTLVKERGWAEIRRPIYDAGGAISWLRWTAERLALVRKDLGELEFARSFLCVPRDEGAQIFKQEHIDACKARGAAKSLLHRLDAVPPGCLVVHGVDIGGGDKDSHAKSAIVSLFIHPNDDRQIIGIRAGRWRGVELLRNLHDVGALYGGILAVENNGVQGLILDIAKQVDIGVLPIIPHHTGMNKADPRFGIATIAAELEAVRWIWPKRVHGRSAEVLSELEVEMIDYAPDAHTGDILMALWIAREIARHLGTKLRRGSRGSIGVRVIG